MIEGLVEDVSRSGLFLRAPMGLRPGSVAEIEVDLAGEPPLYLAAEVVRVEVGSGREGMGLKFVASPEQNRSLANFIMRHNQFGR